MKPVNLVFFSYLAICLLVALLIWLNPNHYTSIDSQYYLQSATHLRDGKGYVLYEHGQYVWNSTFPIGYPALIALVSWSGMLSALAASKLVNGLALGLFTYVWTLRLGARQSLWFLAIWATGPFLRLLAYTWSETVFLVVLAEWVWQVHALVLHSTKASASKLLLLSISLFLVRYVGGFCVSVLLLLVIGLPAAKTRWGRLWSQELNTTFPKHVGWVIGVGTACLCGYFWLNLQLSGSGWGGERVFLAESVPKVLRLFAFALLNECLLIRDFSLKNANGLAWLGLLVQSLLIGMLLWPITNCWERLKRLPTPGLLSWLFAGTGICYLLVLVGLRLISPFDGPNQRLLSPFTFCLLMAGLIWVGSWPLHAQRRFSRIGLLLLLLSWLELLPHAHLTDKLGMLLKFQGTEIQKPLLPDLQQPTIKHHSLSIIHYPLNRLL